MSFDGIIETLFNYYNISSITELADKFNVSQPTISKWKSRNSINPIKKKCRELGIYNDIFGDINSNTQTVANNSGQVAQTVKGNQNFNSEPKKIDPDDGIDSATYQLFIEAYNKAKDNNDLRGLRVHLMDY